MKLVFILFMSSMFYGQKMTQNLDFYTSYHQFYLADKNSPKNTDSNQFWTEKASSDKLAIGSQILGISTASYGPIKGEILILEHQPNDNDFSKFDHVIEAGLNIDSGVIQVLDCPNFNIEKEIKVQPGTYRIRIYMSNLNINDEDEGGDYYKIEIWRSDKTKTRLLKVYP